MSKHKALSLNANTIKSSPSSFGRNGCFPPHPSQIFRVMMNFLKIASSCPNRSNGLRTLKLKNRAWSWMDCFNLLCVSSSCLECNTWTSVIGTPTSKTYSNLALDGSFSSSNIASFFYSSISALGALMNKGLNSPPNFVVAFISVEKLLQSSTWNSTICSPLGNACS